MHHCHRQRHGYGHRGEHAVDAGEVSFGKAPRADFDVPDEIGELAGKPVLEQARGAPTRRAHQKDVLLLSLAVLGALDSERERQRDVAHLVVKGLHPTAAHQMHRGFGRHGIGERARALEVVEKRILHLRMTIQTRKQRLDVACEVEAKLQIIAKVELEGVVHGGDHELGELPNLGSDARAVLTSRGI